MPQDAAEHLSQSTDLAGRPQTDKPLTVSLPALVDGADDSRFRAFIANLFAVSARLQALRRIFGKAMLLSAAQFSVLTSVWHLQEDDGVGIRALADHIHVAAANVTAEVGKLVALGLLSKETDPADSRAVRVKLTEKSEELLSRVAPFLCDVNDKLFEGMSAREFKTVQTFLERFIAQSEAALMTAAELEGEALRAKPESLKTHEPAAKPAAVTGGHDG